MIYVKITNHGKCPICGKKLKEGECIFICNECKKKDKEWRKEHEGLSHMGRREA